ncbi:MAG TPA: hypothetical protein P5075_10840 [Eubacteriales bacterium]|nr:hypothetical protein [Eubacteriales bacterium]
MIRFRQLARPATAVLLAVLFLPVFACSEGAGAAADASATASATATPGNTPEASETPDASAETPASAAMETPTAQTPVTEADTQEQDTVNGTGAYTITADIREEGKSYVSSAADENALRVENACTASVEDGTIEKLAGDASASDASAQFGLNAAVLTHGGAALTLQNSSVTSDAAGASGIFVYGAASSVSAESTSVRTAQDNACGLAAAGGAMLEAKNLSVLTQGASSAAILAQSGASVIVDAGTYAASGQDSAAVVSYSNVSVSNATLRSSASGAVCVYGGGNVMLTGCTVSGSSSALRSGTGKDEPCVLLARSEENDGASAVFTMTNGSLKSGGAALFSVTGTDAALTLSGVSLTLGNGVLLRVKSDAQSGEKGSCTMDCDAQVLAGKILVEEGSSLNLQMTGGSSFSGTVNPSGAAGDVSVTLEDGCTWSLSADAYVTSFTGKTKNIETNGFTLYVNGSAVTK